MRKVHAVWATVLVTSLLISVGATIWVTRPTTADKLGDQADSLIHQWDLPTGPYPGASTAPKTVIQEVSPKDHSYFGVILIPSIHLKFPLVEGTDEHADLSRGVGHYMQTALAGEVGNFAIAGHVCCQNNGMPFRYLKKLKQGDKVIVQTKSAIYTYHVIKGTSCGNSPLTVPMNRIEVINPIPCELGVPTRKLMTLQTCTDYTGSPSTHRVLVWAELESAQARVVDTRQVNP